MRESTGYGKLERENDELVVMMKRRFDVKVEERSKRCRRLIFDSAADRNRCSVSRKKIELKIKL